MVWARPKLFQLKVWAKPISDNQNHEKQRSEPRKKQTKPPTKKSRVTKSYIHECMTYEVNQAKWKAAVEFCKDHLIEFKIITEEELGIK